MSMISGTTKSILGVYSSYGLIFGSLQIVTVLLQNAAGILL